MTDDIVAELRMWGTEYGVGEVCLQAADEIERLRERLYRWRDVADALHYDMCLASGKSVLDGERLYREARAEWDQMEKEAANG